MALVKLTDTSQRTQFFRQTVQHSLNHWLASVEQVKDTGFARLDKERDNILKAIFFAFEVGQSVWPLTQSLITALAPYMERRGFWDIWHEVMRRALHLAEQWGDEAGWVQLSALFARLLSRQSRYQEATHIYRRTIRRARHSGDKFNEGRACSNLGYYYVEKGQWQRAEVLCYHALNLFEELDSNHGRAHTHNHLGFLYSWQHRWPEAQQQLERACTLWAAMPDTHNLMRGNLNLGGLYLRMEQPDEAVSYLEKALTKAQLSGEEMVIGVIYTNLGMAYRLKQNFGVAETYFKQAEIIFQRASNLTELARTWNQWGLSYCQQNQWADAKVLLEKSLAVWNQLGNHIEEIEVLLDITEGELAQSNYQAAALRLTQAERRLKYTPKDARHHHFQPRLEKYHGLLDVKN